MDYKEFIQRVQQTLSLDDPEEAKTAAAAALEVLGERLPRVHRQHLAAQLPSELSRSLLRAKRSVDLPLERYYDRVAARARLNYHEAMRRSRGVMAVVGEAVSPGELDDFLREIPHQYDELFGREHPNPAMPRAMVDTHETYSR